MKSLQYNLFIYLIVLSRSPIYHGVEIIGGHEVEPHSRPYMVSIQDYNCKAKCYTHHCGGALISPKWILTAAHCKLHRQFQVVLGAHSLKQNEKSQQILRVKKQYPHPEFDNIIPDNDIMLLELSGKAKLNKYVQLLELPKNNSEDVKPGTLCTVAGWGATAKLKPPSETLREVKLSVIDRKECKVKDRSSNCELVITKDMICVGDSKHKKDSYKGDSGGPLICNNKYKGIVSYGPPDLTTKEPGIYTRISKKYLDWIANIIGVETSNMTAEGFY